MVAEAFILCFIPLLVAVDAVGTLPIYLGLTQGLTPQERTRLLWHSLVTATLVAVGFLYAGRAVFQLLGITSADFMIAGGVLLLVLSVSDLLSGQKVERQVEPDSLGVVPLGVPLIVGPAVLTTVLLLSDRYGHGPTALALLSNLLLAGMTFRFAEVMNRVLGTTGMRVVSKIASLILAAIAVRLIREALTGLWR